MRCSQCYDRNEVTFDHMQTERLGTAKEVLLVSLNRPARANAYTKGMLDELGGLIESASVDRSIRFAIVTGQGKSFCGGADLSELGTRTAEDALTLQSRDVFDRWAEAPWPTIAAINGAAVAGGFELALACDLRICGPDAHFRLPEVGIGLVPAAGGIRRLVAELGPARAKELVLFDRRLDADTALQWGLVAEIAADPRARAIAVALSLADRDPLCLWAAKMLISDQADAVGGRRAEKIAEALFYDRRHKKTST
jgi:enoyl-CoA hydratase/carnithine racemase